jgi:hypothetical protein
MIADFVLCEGQKEVAMHIHNFIADQFKLKFPDATSIIVYDADEEFVVVVHSRMKPPNHDMFNAETWRNECTFEDFRFRFVSDASSCCIDDPDDVIIDSPDENKLDPYVQPFTINTY